MQTLSVYVDRFVRIKGISIVKPFETTKAKRNNGVIHLSCQTRLC